MSNEPAPARTPAEEHRRRTLLGLVGGFLALLVIIVLVGWITDSEESNAVDPLLNRDFETLDGDIIDLADLRGQPVVVNLFASWCTACIAEMPDFEEVNQDLGDSVQFIGLNVDETSIEDARQLVADTGVTYPIAVGASRDSVEGIIAMPTTIVYTPDGVRCELHSGVLNAEALTSLIQECS